jgi:hypothetical protein
MAQETPNPDTGSQNPNPDTGSQNPNPDTGSQNPDEGGGLPSAQEGLPTLNFELTDEIKEKFITSDGKVLGKYESLDQLAEAHKHLQDKHAQTVEDYKKQQKELNGDIETQQTEAKRMETIKDILPEFLNNDMQLTPEIETKLTEEGIDIRDVKLGALELRDKINAAHETVGGKENYEAMMGWASSQLSDAEKAAFDADIMGAQSRFAIKGLYSEYQAAAEKGEATPPQRLNGDNTVKTVQPYEDRQALLRDKQYIDSPAGKRDQAAQNRYKQRLAITPEAVWRGY